MNDSQIRKKYIDYNEKDYVNAVKIGQDMILEFVRDYFGGEKLIEVKSAINNYPIYFFDEEKYKKNQREHLDDIVKQDIALAYVSNTTVCFPNNFTKISKKDMSYDTVISAVIHEYGHVLRKMNSNYGNLFEEGFVTIFAEACITHHRMKGNSNYNPNDIYNLSGSKNYFKAESQVRSILYFLNQKNLDISLLGEYIFGDEDKFINKCVELFGDEFAHYFKIANSDKDEYYNNYTDEKNNSELVLIDILSNYIGYNQNIENNNKTLYRKESETVAKSIAKSDYKPKNEKDMIAYQKYVNIAEFAWKEEREDNLAREETIKDYVFKKCSLSGKNKNEIYDIVLGICIEYIKRSSSDRVENKMFIQELKSFIPNLEKIVDMIRTLRSNGVMNLDFNDLDNNNITYDSIYDSLKMTYDNFKDNKSKEIKEQFDKCKTKNALFKTIDNIELYKNIVDINTIFPNYSNFVKYVKTVEKEIPEVFDNSINGYNSIYKAVLEMYLLYKEKELTESKRLESEYASVATKLDKQFRIIENSEDFKSATQIGNEQQDNLNYLNNKIDVENKNNKINEEERNRLYLEHSKLKNKNFIVRLFQRKKIKNIENEIKEIESKIQKSIDNIKELENDISNVKKKIKDNENSLLEKYGISISEYKTLLDEISKDNLTEEEIAKRVLEMQKKIQALNIQDREKEIQDIYEKNSVILNNENVIEQDNNLKK